MDTLAHLKSVLSQQGLSNDEIACYLSLLQGRPMSALELSRASSIPRTSAYRALDLLRVRGLVSEETRNRRTLYSAEHPRALLHEVHLREKSLSDAIPLFDEMIFRHPANPATKVFTGRKGFGAALESFYDHVQRKKATQVFSLSHPDLIRRYPKIFANAVERRERLKVHTFLMMPTGVAHPRSKFLVKNSLRDVRYVPQAFARNASMLIGGDAVLYISLGDKDAHAILVHSEAIAYLLREFFKLVWNRVAITK